MSQERVEIERVPPPDDAALVRPGYPRALGYPEVYGSSDNYGYSTAAPPSEGINLRELWRIIRKRKWLIVVLAAIATTVVAIDIYRTKSTYRASATIEIAKDSSALVKAANLLVLTDDAENLKTKMLILKSRPLLEEVAAELHLDQQPRFLDVGSRKSVWEALKTISNKIPGPVHFDEGPAVADAGISPKSGGARTVDDSKRLAPYVNILASLLNVEQVPETRALIVSFTHTDPAIAAAIANGTAQIFIQKSFENKTEKFTRTSEWLDTTTRKLQAKVEEAEQTLAAYTREHNIFSTDPKDTFATDKLARLQDQVMRAETDRILKQSLYDEVKAGRVAQLPEAFSDTRTGALQEKLNTLTTQAAEFDVKYGPDNPKVREVQQQIAAIEHQIVAGRNTLQEKLKADFERSVREAQSLKSAFELAKAEASQQNQANIQHSLLKQDVDTAKGLYTEFLQKTSQAEVQRAEQHNDIRLIEPAQVPGGPVGPQRMRTIMIGLFLSLIAGIALAFFLEYLDNTIKTVEDVSRYTQLPALGIIPAISTSSPLRLPSRKKGLGAGSDKHGALARYKSTELVALETRSTAAEAYRVLRTSVLLSTAGSPPKKILVTSGQPGEGKTTTVVNTAISLAQLGATVLIVDCDLRKPATHKIFNVDQTRGLSTFLSRDVPIEDLIQKLPIPNLWLLPCGPIPPNPAELISSDRMKGLLKLLAERFDHVLIDSPPLIHVTDPVILSTMVDGVMLVVHGGKSTRDVVRRAKQELTNVGAKIFGVVLNNVDLKREGYDQYYYYRYYTEYGHQPGEGSNA